MISAKRGGSAAGIAIRRRPLNQDAPIRNPVGVGALGLGALLAVAILMAACTEQSFNSITVPGPTPVVALDERWQAELPLAGDAALLGAYLAPDGRAWIVGAGGLVLHWRDGRWENESVPTDATLSAVAGLDGDLLFAVGVRGTILRRQEQAWTREDSGTDADLLDVVVTADGSVTAVGRDGTLLRRVDGRWGRYVLSSSADLLCVAPWRDGVLVGGARGALFGLRPGQVVDLGGELFQQAPVSDVVVSDMGEILVVAYALYRYRDERWELTMSTWSGSLASLALHGSTLYLGRTFDSVGWVDLAELPSPAWLPRAACPGGPVSAISTAPDGSVLAVGMQGGIVWRRDGEWRVDPAGWLGGVLCFRFQDGSLLLFDGEAFYDRTDDRWQRRCDSPAGFPSIVPSDQTADGPTSENFYYLGWPGNFARYRDGVWTVLQEQNLDVYGHLVVAGETPYAWGRGGVWRWEGDAWRLDLPETGGWGLFRTGAGDVVFVAARDLYHLVDGAWLRIGGSISQDSWNVVGCAGTVAGRLLVLLPHGYCERSAEPDSARVVLHSTYDFPAGVTGSVRCVAENESGVYVGTDYPGYVLRLNPLGSSRRWSVVAGPVGERLFKLVLLPDGSLLAFCDQTYRIYRYPPPAP
jgi:hypothetical protein